MRRSLVFVLLVLAACASVPAPPEKAPASFPMLQPCTLEKVAGPAFCGKLDVPEDRSRRGGRTISLNVAVVPAQTATRAADPLFAVLGGGPGVAGVPELPSFLATHAELARDRDVVAVDARGTGESNPLDCAVSDPVAAFLAGEMPVADMRACRDRLQANADLAAYTTAAAADDLDDVRRWLGYSRANVYGGSYASRIALVYAQRHPAQTRSVIMKAPFPFANQNPLHTAADSQAALERVFADCAADAACASAFPTLRADFEAVLTQFDTRPATVEVGGKPVTVTRDVFAGVIRRMLYAADTQRAIPVTIAMVRRGELGGLSRILGAASAIDRVLNVGLFLSVTCAEDVAQYDAADVTAAVRGTFTGDRLATPLLQVCRDWPTRPVGAERPAKVPALIIAGTLDPQTPPRWAHEAKKSLPLAVVVEAEGVAHSGTTPCITSLIHDFVRQPSAPLDASCAKAEKRPAFSVPKP